MIVLPSPDHCLVEGIPVLSVVEDVEQGSNFMALFFVQNCEDFIESEETMVVQSHEFLDSFNVCIRVVVIFNLVCLRVSPELSVDFFLVNVLEDFQDGFLFYQKVMVGKVHVLLGNDNVC